MRCCALCTQDKAKNKPSGLSFDDELEEEEEALSPGAKVIGGMSAARAKEAAEAAERQEAAMREVIEQTRKAQREPLTLNYVYRSAATQKEVVEGVLRGSVVVTRGATADEVAIAVRTDVESLGGKFAPVAVQGIREERDVVMTCCCEGMALGSFLVPGAVKLTELWNRKWADQPGQAGGIFDEFKHGVVVSERRWYEAQRHTYPYSHWRQYDTLTEYSKAEFIATRDEPAYKFEINRASAADRKKQAAPRR